MYGWVIYNGHLPGDTFINFAKWIRNAGLEKGITIDIVKNNSLFAELSKNKNQLIRTVLLKNPDFVIFNDKDIPLARQLEAMNIPVFNSSSVIEICDNKIDTYQRLVQHKLPIPKSFISPKIFPGVEEIDMESFLMLEQQLDYPFVIKEAYGSFGEQVYLIKNTEEFTKKLNEIKEKPFVIQEFISTSVGRDVRLNVVGKRVVASILRKANNDFRANVQAGGTTEQYTPTKQQCELAIEAVSAIGADFAGVDLLFGKNGDPIICEVNSNPHIQGTYRATGINVAEHIIDYIEEKLR
ncbi:ATP-grasp domain-containing protein [Aquibacillus albus]|uniref:Ribosomal protein S6--L-glutamate ligase/gamma-F420-2:alpha-L-glutamate ligase n=1 Tax=Aquibacillus albus TaxID=1168171 RepID=A0ABS2N1K5_9BACI|nr:RimK family alpha-L-glutamate ligase [Aquibacillus albus]MBM7572015.1 ribosomal protein S6--L-glutamate ligase/gamma-F420-2:alpha-L-glutamate ligase [Aquibacillus albus]